ncbi:MAG: exodeoxyribonuclease VII large subunit, partial [Betaproteobacteria bacterium]
MPQPRLVWSVAALVDAVSDALAARFAACTVRGELSAFTRAASGHCYFALKDADGAAALLRCAMFRRAGQLLAFAPSEGQLVELRGRLAMYEPRGELQFIVEFMQPAGAGALYEQFLRLKAKLQAEGLFDPTRHRPLPAHPRAIGVVTSLGAAALHDVLSVFERRAPHVGVVVYPSAVQGPDAPAGLVDAIGQANRRAEVDAILVCRGGGSLEDLWAFNDERVVRAIAGSELPVVSAVGHETDVTLADLAADVRAPTPSVGAELVAPAHAKLLDHLAALERRVERAARHRLDTLQQRLDRAAAHLVRPSQWLGRERLRLALLATRLPRAARQVR